MMPMMWSMIMIFTNMMLMILIFFTYFFNSPLKLSPPITTIPRIKTNTKPINWNWKW